MGKKIRTLFRNDVDIGVSSDRTIEDLLLQIGQMFRIMNKIDLTCIHNHERRTVLGVKELIVGIG